ncbi:hypothetical protein LFZ31_20045, partial [Salmonella enterica subsp. enterica serovar Newport str. S09097]
GLKNEKINNTNKKYDQSAEQFIYDGLLTRAERVVRTDRLGGFPEVQMMCRSFFFPLMGIL